MEDLKCTKGYLVDQHLYFNVTSLRRTLQRYTIIGH